MLFFFLFVFVLVIFRLSLLFLCFIAIGVSPFSHSHVLFLLLTFSTSGEVVFNFEMDFDWRDSHFLAHRGHHRGCDCGVVGAREEALLLARR